MGPSCCMGGPFPRTSSGVFCLISARMLCDLFENWLRLTETFNMMQSKEGHPRVLVDGVRSIMTISSIKTQEHMSDSISSMKKKRESGRTRRQSDCLHVPPRGDWLLGPRQRLFPARRRGSPRRLPRQAPCVYDRDGCLLGFIIIHGIDIQANYYSQYNV